MGRGKGYQRRSIFVSYREGEEKLVWRGWRREGEAVVVMVGGSPDKDPMGAQPSNGHFVLAEKLFGR